MLVWPGRTICQVRRFLGVFLLVVVNSIKPLHTIFLYSLLVSIVGLEFASQAAAKSTSIGLIPTKGT